jgi:hypothetical protein
MYDEDDDENDEDDEDDVIMSLTIWWGWLKYWLQSYVVHDGHENDPITI